MTPLQAQWVRCREWIEAAVDHAFGYTIEDVEADVGRGEAVLWPGEKSAIVTQVWPFPRAKGLNLWLAGGHLDELVNKLLPRCEIYARASGCTHIIIAGRAGWVRALKAKGYAPAWTALVKELG